MGAAAVPYMMMAFAAVGTYTSIKSSKQQQALLNAQAQQEGKMIDMQAKQQAGQIEAQSKEDEITRLRMLRETLGQNILSAVGSGITMEGTPSAIIEGNIEDARQDISTIQLNRESATKQLEAGASAQRDAANVGLVGMTSALQNQQTAALIQGAGQIAGAYGETFNTSGTVSGES